MRQVIISFTLLFLFLCPIRTIGQSAYVRIIDPEYVPIVEDLTPNSKRVTSSKAEYREFLQQYNFKEFKQAFPTIKSKWLLDVYYVEMQTEEELDAFIKTVSKDYSKQIPLIEKIGTPVLTGTSYIPDDSLFLAGEQSNLSLVRAPEAWYIAKHYPKVKVGVTDSYFHEPHPDLHFDAIYGPNVYDTINRDHGTVVAGLIGAITDNHIGIASVGGFNTKMLAYSSRGEYEVFYLVQQGCKVINCSWYTNTSYVECIDSFYSCILHNYDCLVVFGAGNEANQGGSLEAFLYPPSYESCLSVTSVGHKYNYGHSSYKNWKDVHPWYINNTARCHHHNTAVDLCAPGYEVRSTNYWREEADYSLQSTGTSFAAPLVTGTAAMIRAVNPSLTAVEVMNILKQTADASIYDIPENAPYIGKLGTGRLDAYKAVRTACANDIENDIISADCVLEGCVVTLKNVDIQEQVDVTIDAVVEAELISGVEIPLGSTLIIQ